MRDGYAATSIAAIAAEAGVAVPTVYASLRNKAGILRAVVQLTVRGDDEAAPLEERAAWRELEAEEDPRRRLARFASLHREVCDREAAVFAQLDAAAGADPEATDARRARPAALQTQRRLARGLHRRRELKPGMSAREAADVIWTLASERTYLALVRDRGWKARALRALGRRAARRRPVAAPVRGVASGHRSGSRHAPARSGRIASVLAFPGALSLPPAWHSRSAPSSRSPRTTRRSAR